MVALALSETLKPFTATNGTTLQTIQFKAKKSGTYTISYVIDEMLDTDENDLVVNCKPVSGVTISENADVNGDIEDATTGSSTVTFKKVTQ